MVLYTSDWQCHLKTTLRPLLAFFSFIRVANYSFFAMLLIGPSKRAAALRAVKATTFAYRAAATTAVNGNIDATKTVVHRTTSPRPKVPIEQLAFGRTFTDHMLSVDWTAGGGWQAPQITPFGDLSLSPACVALHYGLQCFEGMKAYKDAQGRVRLFRPDCNMQRLNYSMQRLAMPAFDGDAFVACLKQLLRLDADWIPSQEGYSMYIRPTAIATAPYLGVHASDQVKLFAILSPVGPYFKDGFKPVKLYADTDNVRAWPGGVGNAKVGGNYGPAILPAEQAKQHGYVFSPRSFDGLKRSQPRARPH